MWREPGLQKIGSLGLGFLFFNYGVREDVKFPSVADRNRRTGGGDELLP